VAIWYNRKKTIAKRLAMIGVKIKITASLARGGYFFLQKMSTMYRMSLTSAITKFIDKNIIITASVANMASPPFRGSANRLAY